MFSLLLLTGSACAEPFKVYLSLKASDGSYIRNGSPKNSQLLTVKDKYTYTCLLDWNGVELVSGDVVSLWSGSGNQHVTKDPTGPEYHWKDPVAGAADRFTVTKVGAAAGSPIQSGDTIRLSLVGPKEAFLGVGSGLERICDYGGKPEANTAWTVRRVTRGNQAARKLLEDARYTADKIRAKQMLEQAFKGGASDAAAQIATLYFDGKLGTQNLAETYAWYQRGAQAGDPSCTYFASVMLYNGRGVTANRSEAVGLCRKAAELGSGAANEQLKMWEVAGSGTAVAAAVAPPPPTALAPKFAIGSIFLPKLYNSVLDLQITGFDPQRRLYTVRSRQRGAKKSDWTVQTSPNFGFENGTIAEGGLEAGWTLSPKKSYCTGCGGWGSLGRGQDERAVDRIRRLQSMLRPRPLGFVSDRGFWVGSFGL